MVSKTKIRVRYAETDKMGIVHHAVYPIWFEAARGDFIRQLGMGYDEIEQAGYMLPLHDLTCSYIRPCRYEEEVTVVTRAIKSNAVKLVLGYEVYGEGEDTPRIKGTTTHAWVHADTFQMANLKKDAPEIYAVVSKGVEV
jgi:acyl-CoA thioester hydrolase